MEKRPFGNTGLQVSVLGFGSANVALSGYDQAVMDQLLNTLLDGGVNVIDTAAAYADSEVMIGNAVASRRDQFVLISKCGNKLEEVDYPEFSAELVSYTVDRALQRLRTDHLDVMLLHSCDLPTLQKGDALGALVKAHEQGKVRFPGYSGDNEAVAWAAAQLQVRVIETSVSFCDQANIDAVLPIARRHGVGVIAKRPIANGAWRPEEQFEGMYKGYARPYRERFAAMGLRLEDLGFQGDPAQAWPRIALRFTLAQDVHTAIIGATKLHHVQQNLATAKEGPLPPSAVTKLRKAFQEAQTKAGKPWPGLT